MKLRPWILLACLPLPALAAEMRQQIHIVGSSTVYPFVTAAAEIFGETGTFKTPIVESTGTGGGFKLFCESAGPQSPDINDASRPITESERQLCAQNGITAIAEIPIGFDGIALANDVHGPHFSLTLPQIFTALARELPDKNGRLQKNPYTHWNEIDKTLPSAPIEVYGRPPTSGTRDAFEELVMDKGCDAFPAFKTTYPNPKDRKAACEAIREDGPYIEASDNNVIVQKLIHNPAALGMVGYSYLEENLSRLQGARIDGANPERASIEDGSYKVSRSLYVYVKNAHIGQVAGLPEFLRELTDDAAIGPDGYLIQRGLLPLPEAQRKKIREEVKALQP